MNRLIYFSFFAFALVIGCTLHQSNSKPDRAGLVEAMYQRRIAHLAQQVATLHTQAAQRSDAPSIQKAFYTARLAYKQVEFLAEYYNPTTAKSLNGPALNEAEEDEGNLVVNPPQGFQVLEELLFPYDTAQQAEIQKVCNGLVINVRHLEYVSRDLRLTDAHVWDAVKLEMFRLVTLGISGFDSPVAFHSMPEAQAAIASLREVVDVYLTNANAPRTASVALAQAFDRAIDYLAQHPDFNTFDRLIFITDFANPLSVALYDAQQALGIPFFTNENRFLRVSAKTLFDSGAFNPDYFRPNNSPLTNDAMVAVGRALFNDPLLGGNGARSCASCHQAERAFSDGLPTSRRFSGQGHIARNAPSLYNVSLQPTQFYEGRVAFLEDQITDVLATPDEMHSSVEEVVAKLNANARYVAKFGQLFTPQVAESGPTGITAAQFKTTLAAYLRSLTSLNSRFDRYVRGERNLLNDQEKWGFNLFMGKAKCATCHFMPLFNGTVPPHYQQAETEVLGVPTRPDTARATIDPDQGRKQLTRIPLHTFAFKTVTVRNAELTAPYMHNGVYQTMAQVIDFYNRGGGAGIGIALDNQTLPPDPLHLTQPEQQALIAFMNALTDAKKQ